MIQTYKILHNIDIVDKDKLFTTAQAIRGHPYKLLSESELFTGDTSERQSFMTIKKIKTEFTGKYLQ